jgi:hypothetical protein
MIRTEMRHGLPVPVYEGTLEELAQQALNGEVLAPYKGENLEMYGKNNLEASIATLVRDAAEGNPAARTELIDRVIGKPLQRQEIKSKNMTLIGFIDQLATEEYHADTDERRETEDTPTFA